MSAENLRRPSLNEKIEALDRRLPIVIINHGNKENIGCGNCVGACCRAGTALLLNPSEADQLRNAGTTLEPIKVPQKRSWLLFKPKTPDRQGYVLKSNCGNLRPDNSCGDYENRPGICRTLQEGDPGCIALRDLRKLPDEIDYSPIKDFTL